MFHFPTAMSSLNVPDALLALSVACYSHPALFPLPLLCLDSGLHQPGLQLSTAEGLRALLLGHPLYYGTPQ